MVVINDWLISGPYEQSMASPINGGLARYCNSSVASMCWLLGGFVYGKLMFKNKVS